ncbi:EamA family transporter RarD [Elstera sp.]|jgi:chloramphenicol-sensitive protein RarD|uniref:EamA family transporter RarD n=1 Tax=Elstera sp. TaxID=1916664 RepID=UPI0037C12A4F
MSPTAAPPTAGYLYALLAFGCWGLAPLYFRLLGSIPTPDMLAHRIVWTLLALAIIVLVSGRLKQVLATARQPKLIGRLVISGLLIGTNWGVWLWAISSGHVLESSLGYFINPLVNTVLGMLVLKERLTPRQGIAVAIAAAGVVGLVLGGGHFPWIALTLAISFGLYGLVRKITPVDPMVGLFFETALVFTPCLAWLTWRGFTDAAGIGVIFPSAGLSALLIGTSIVTIVPLAAFVAATRRLPYATVGIFQYISPSGQFLLGITLYGETFTQGHAIAFGCIWVSLALYTSELVRKARVTAAA